MVTRRAREGPAVKPPSLALRVTMLQLLFCLGGTAQQKLRFGRLLAWHSALRQKYL